MDDTIIARPVPGDIYTHVRTNVDYMILSTGRIKVSNTEYWSDGVRYINYGIPNSEFYTDLTRFLRSFRKKS